MCRAAGKFLSKNVCEIGQSPKYCKIERGSYRSLSADFLLSKNHITQGQRELTLIIQYLIPHFSNFKNQYTLNSTAICYLWQIPFSIDGFKYKQSR